MMIQKRLSVKPLMRRTSGQSVRKHHWHWLINYQIVIVVLFVFMLICLLFNLEKKVIYEWVSTFTHDILRN